MKFGIDWRTFWTFILVALVTALIYRYTGLRDKS